MNRHLECIAGVSQQHRIRIPKQSGSLLLASCALSHSAGLGDTTLYNAYTSLSHLSPPSSTTACQNPEQRPRAVLEPFKPRHESGIKADTGAKGSKTDRPPPVMLELNCDSVLQVHTGGYNHAPLLTREDQGRPLGSLVWRGTRCQGQDTGFCLRLMSSMWKPTPRQHPGCRISNGFVLGNHLSSF